MTRYRPLLFTLAAVWGASYLFIKVAVEGGFDPASLMATRMALAAVCLFAFAAVTLGGRRTLAELRGSWRYWAVLGIVGNAIPFWLVAWGVTHIDSGVAGIAQATVPIFTVLLGLRFLPHEPMGVCRWLGIGLGLAGAGVLAGLDPQGGWRETAGTLAVVLASLAYATGNVIGQPTIATASGPVLACGSMAAGAVFLAPFALAQPPDGLPSAKAIASLLTLTVLGTAFAQLLLFRMWRLHGGRRTSLVTYLIPGFALVYGALLLDEEISVAALAGLVLILLGVALGSGALLSRRRRPLLAGTGR